MIADLLAYIAIDFLIFVAGYLVLGSVFFGALGLLGRFPLVRKTSRYLGQHSWPTFVAWVLYAPIVVWAWPMLRHPDPSQMGLSWLAILWGILPPLLLGFARSRGKQSQPKLEPFELPTPNKR